MSEYEKQAEQFLSRYVKETEKGKLVRSLIRRLPIALAVSLIVSLVVPFLPVQTVNANGYTIIGDTVVISTDKGGIIVTPHTLTASGWVTVEFQSKSFTDNVDVVLGFNGVDQVQTIKADNYEGSQWKPSNGGNKPAETVYSGNGANKWQSIQSSASVVQNTWYKARFWVEIPLGFVDNPIGGKYNVLIKPSSVLLKDALSSGNCVLLDPWYNVAWTYRKSATISNSSINYQTKLIVHYGSGADTTNTVYLDSHSRTDFGDVRFTGADKITLLDYWVESVYTSDNATIWVENDATPSTTCYIYYGNAAATTTSNGTNTFIVFDDFERGVNGDAIGGSWTVVSGAATISTTHNYTAYTSAGAAGTRSSKLAGHAAHTLITIPVAVTVLVGFAVALTAPLIVAVADNLPV